MHSPSGKNSLVEIHTNVTVGFEDLDKQAPDAQGSTAIFHDQIAGLNSFCDPTADSDARAIQSSRFGAGPSDA